MADNSLSPEVRQLVESHLVTMDHVEILLRLADNPSASIARDDIVRESGRPAALVDAALADLTQSGLVSAKTGTADVMSYAYAPRNEELRRSVVLLQETYNERPVTLIRDVYERASRQPVISLAEAFRVRGDGK